MLTGPMGPNSGGRVSGVTDTVNAGESATYGYDYMNRLLNATAPNWALQWTYDEFGNRLTQSGTGSPAPPQMTLSYDEANHITTSGYQYDLSGNGNMTAIRAPSKCSK